jgi:hypothetical protein
MLESVCLDTGKGKENDYNDMPKYDDEVYSGLLPAVVPNGGGNV